MFWFLSIRYFGPEYFLKMNISVNISDLRPCSHCYKNVILEFRPLYFAQKCPQNAGNAIQRPKIQKLSGYIPPDLNMSSMFTNVFVTYFVPPKKNPNCATD